MVLILQSTSSSVTVMCKNVCWLVSACDDDQSHHDHDGKRGNGKNIKSSVISAAPFHPTTRSTTYPVFLPFPAGVYIYHQKISQWLFSLCNEAGIL